MINAFPVSLSAFAIAFKAEVEVTLPGASTVSGSGSGFAAASAAASSASSYSCLSWWLWLSDSGHISMADYPGCQVAAGCLNMQNVAACWLFAAGKATTSMG